MRYFSLIIAILFYSSVLAQKPYIESAKKSPYGPSNLISNFLSGSGIEIIDVQFIGDSTSCGRFRGFDEAIGINSGIAISTGFIYNILNNGSNFSSTNTVDAIATDNLLTSLLNEGQPTDLYDINKFVIKFRPRGNKISLKYVFGSEEYPDYACTTLGDPFGIFLSGPGYPTPTNIALVPGTNLPVSINTVNPGDNNLNCPANSYSAFYNDNYNALSPPVFNGFLDPFVAEAAVSPCGIYTLEISIADLGEASFDSGLFFEDYSFTSEYIRLSTELINTAALIEGTTDTLILSIPIPLTSPAQVMFTTLGAAQNGVDYLLQDAFNVPSGVSSVKIPISILADNLEEPLEYIGIVLTTFDCVNDTLWLPIDGLPEFNTPDLPDEIDICFGESTLLNYTVQPDVGSNNIYTTQPDVNLLPVDSLHFFPFEVNNQYIGKKGLENVIEKVCVNVKSNWIDDWDAFLVAPDGRFIEMVVDIGHNSNNAIACFVPFGADDVYSVNEDIIAAHPPVGNVLATDTTLYFQGLFNFQGDYKAFNESESNGIWNLMMLDDQTGFVVRVNSLKVSMQPPLQYNYSWQPTAGLSCANCPTPIASPDTTTMYYVTATSTFGNIAIDSVLINVNYEAQTLNSNCQNTGVDEVTVNWLESPVFSSYVLIYNDDTISISPDENSYVISGLNGGSELEVLIQGTANASCPSQIETLNCAVLPCAQSNSLSTSVIAPSCLAQNDGQIIVSSSNSNVSFTYSITNDTLNLTNQDGIFVLPAGAYTVAATNLDNCTTTLVATIPEPSFVINGNVNVEVVDIICYDDQNGSVSIDFEGSSAVSFNWSTGAIGPITSGLAAGIYTVTATNNEGCSLTFQASIGDPNNILLVYVSGIEVFCATAEDNILMATPINTTDNVNFTWSSTSLNSQSINILGPGIYTVTITNENGCTASNSVEVFAYTGTEPCDSIIEDSTLQVNNMADDGICFSLAPNPGEDVTIITTKCTNIENAVVYFYDGMGKLLNAYPLNRTETKIDISGYPTGEYLYKIISNNRRQYSGIFLKI